MTLSPSGARLQGDDYQHLVSWYHALRMLLPGSDVTAISMEVRGSGIVDDLNVHRRDGNDEYYQLKFSVDASNPIDNAWWIHPSDSGGPSILKRFWDSFQRLRKPGYVPRLALYTNRPTDSRDPVLKLRDGLHGCLGTRLRGEGPRSEAGKRRKQWADHMVIPEDALLEMLDHLALYTDQGPWSSLVTSVADRMAACGLKFDERSIEQGMLACHNWVKLGTTRIDRAMLEAEIRKRSLLGEAPWVTFVVQAIDRHPWAADAQATVDWVDLYDGERPEERVRLKDPALWNSRLLPELREAVTKLEAARCDRIMIRGHMRLPTVFMVGRSLPEVRGFHLACMQRQERWTTEVKRAEVQVFAEREELDLGNELAVGVSVARNLGRDVIAYAREAKLPIKRFVHLHLEEAHAQAMSGASEALGWALAVRDRIADELRETRARKIHLFLSTPAGAALFLGHFWNRIGATQLYEHVDAQTGYEPAFFVPA